MKHCKIGIMRSMAACCRPFAGSWFGVAGWLRGLVAENQSLRHHLGYACQQAGLPLPHMPAPVHEAVQQVLGLSTVPVEEQKCAPVGSGKVRYL